MLIEKKENNQYKIDDENKDKSDYHEEDIEEDNHEEEMERKWCKADIDEYNKNKEKYDEFRKQIDNKSD